MEVGRGGRSLMRVILIVNFVVYLIVLGLATWSIDKYIDGEQDHPHLGGNPSTSFMLIFALIAGAIGECSVVIGFTHLRAWRSDSLATAASSAIIAWATTVLAFGLVCKEVIMGGHRGKRHISSKPIDVCVATACRNVQQQVRTKLWIIIISKAAYKFLRM